MATQDEEWEELYLFAKRMAEKDPDFIEIEKQLSEKTYNPVLVAEIIKHVKQVHYAIKQKQGLIKMGFGGILLLVGFFITVLNYHANESFSLVMYGFTSAGLLLIFWGLYDVFG